jgi:hypothetical protein
LCCVCCTVRTKAKARTIRTKQYRQREKTSRWSHWNLSLTQSSRSRCGPEVDSAFNINEYLGDKGGRCLQLTTLPRLCAECLEILEASGSWSHKGLPRPVMGELSYCGLPLHNATGNHLTDRWCVTTQKNYTMHPHRYIVQTSSDESVTHWTLKMVPIYGPETLVKNQRKATLGNNPKVITS